MSENTQSGSNVEQFSQKITRDTKEQLAIIRNGGGFESWSQVFDTLIERYNAPIKAQDQSKKIEELESEIKRLRESQETNRISSAQLEKDRAETMSNYDSLLEKFNSLTTEKTEVDNALKELKQKSESLSLAKDERIVIIDELNWRVLQFVAERESERRNQEWTVSDVINYFVEFRFVRGSLNGDLNSVSNSEIAKIKSGLTVPAVQK